jgi:hypothetical protein
MKTTTGNLNEKENQREGHVLWLGAAERNELIRNLSYVTRANPESIGHETLLGIHTIISNSMPKNVALLLPSAMNSMRPLLLTKDILKERDVDYSIYKLIEWITSKGIVLLTLES